jgi:hypothetical protein
MTREKMASEWQDESFRRMAIPLGAAVSANLQEFGYGG